MSNNSPNDRDRKKGFPTVSDDAIRDAVSRRMQEQSDDSPDTTTASTSVADGGTAAADTTTETPLDETFDAVEEDSSNIDNQDDHDDGSSEEFVDEESEIEDTSRPYIRITPAREQVTPKQVVKGLYGFYRAGNGHRMPFNLEERVSFINPQSTFEFLIHKPQDTRRFEFYLGVHPYTTKAFKNLASNISSMYPETFSFEIVSFSPSDAFRETSAQQAGLNALAELEELGEIQGIQGFEQVKVSPNIEVPIDSSEQQQAEEHIPSMARWVGVETRKNDWMTLLSRFTEVAVTAEDSYRSPLSVLLEQAAGTDESFLFQVVFSPRPDWTKEAERQKRNLKMGHTGTFDAFKNEFYRFITGADEYERRQYHRPDTPEQIGGTVTSGSGDDSTQHGRMGQIDLKQPTMTFDISIRAAGEADIISTVTGAFGSLSGPYYGIEGKFLGEDEREFERLCNADLSYSTLKGRFGKTTPVIVASPDELANFVAVPNTSALPKVSRGVSGGTPDVRSPLTATDEELLTQFGTGLCIGNAETAAPDRDNIPIHLTAEQLTHHVLRASTTGGGKTTAMINDGLSAYANLDGPVFIFDKKGGSMCEEYKKAHFKKFGNLDDVVHLQVPGPNSELPAFPFFDIRPQLAAGIARETAVQEKVDRYNELLAYVLGEEQHNQAFVAQEILSNLIVALFDPVHGHDAYAISDLLKAAYRMQTEQVIPTVSDPELEATLSRHFSADDYRFQTSIDAVMNRITKLRERDFIWRLLNFVPEWDEDRQQYADNQMLFNLDEILDSNKVILFDTGEFRPASSNLFMVLMLDYLWSWVRLRKRWSKNVPSPDDGYVINLIIDEAAPIMQASLVRDEMIPDAREFALGFELIVHFPEQVKRDALDTKAYKEILRNINTKLIGKLAIDDELAVTLFHEDLDADELADRITSLPRGEWLAQLPDTGFMTDTPELVTLKPLPIPSGHSDSDEPVDPGTYSPTTDIMFKEADERQWSRTRFTYCLIPGVNSPPDAAQREARYGAGVMNSNAANAPSGDPESTQQSGAPHETDDSNELADSGNSDASTGGADQERVAADDGIPEEATDTPDESDSESSVTDRENTDVAELITSDHAEEQDTGDDRSTPIPDNNDSERLDNPVQFNNEHGTTLGTGGQPAVNSSQSEPDGNADGDGTADRSDSSHASNEPPVDDLAAIGRATSSSEQTADQDGIDDPSNSGPKDDTTTSSDAENEVPPGEVPQNDGEGLSNPDDVEDAVDDGNVADLTTDEQTFLRNVIKAVNGELEGYDLLESMTTIRNTSGSNIDEDKLVEADYIEIHRRRGGKYYTVTPEGQRVVDRKVYHGPGNGDIHEKTPHKVLVEAFARWLEQEEDDNVIVEKYYEPMGNDAIYDVAAFRPQDDGSLQLSVIGEAVTNLPHSTIVKHYDDMARLDGARKRWIVPNKSTARDVLAALAKAGRINEKPTTEINTYGKLNDFAFGDSNEWRIIGAAEILGDLKGK